MPLGGVNQRVDLVRIGGQDLEETVEGQGVVTAGFVLQTFGVGISLQRGRRRLRRLSRRLWRAGRRTHNFDRCPRLARSLQAQIDFRLGTHVLAGQPAFAAVL
jgi:hypothetical protein